MTSPAIFQTLKSGAVISRLTSDQLCLFDMITTCVKKKGKPPTKREIQFYFGLGSLINVPPMLNALVERKLITRNDTKQKKREAKSEIDQHLDGGL
jgi:SOS-response transcriptional repressor LexA